MAALSLPCKIARKGLINLPGITAASKKKAEAVLKEDAEDHHCFFRMPGGLHNHLSHHIFAAYDLGAPPSLLQKIYDDEARIQRPFFIEEKEKDIIVSEENWTQFIGNPSAYGGFVKFFSQRVQELGVCDTIEKYVFSEDANKPGRTMILRLIDLHPVIQLGYALEFGNDTFVATALSQTAVHIAVAVHPSHLVEVLKPSVNTSISKGTSLLEIIRQVYESDILTPVMPYDPNQLLSARRAAVVTEERLKEIHRISSQFVVNGENEAELQSKVEELFWFNTLLLFATGKEGRKPRLDFFLMHLLTPVIFFPSYFKVLKNPEHKAALLRAFIPTIILFMLIRGRPRINPTLLMSYTDTPRPPMDRSALPNPHSSAIGSPLNDADYNPWPAIIEAALYCPDTHVIKVIRCLMYAAQHYGTTPPGAAIGTFQTEGEQLETHRGAAAMDGTIFVRAAGIVMDYMGWVSYGQSARPDWDRSALGWDAAWDMEDHSDLIIAK